MKPVILLAHPYCKSFNHHVKDVVVESFKQSGKDPVVIDLSDEGFNPVLSTEDLRLYMRGETSDPKVREYQSLLNACDELVIIFPIWWYEAPALLKGFLDKVFLPGFAFDETEEGLVGKLGHIKRTTILTTSEVETEFMREKVGNPIETSLLETTFEICGITSDKLWLNCEHIASGTEIERLEFLEKVRARILT